MDFEQAFPGAAPAISEIASELQGLILELFPAAIITSDRQNVGYGRGSGRKDLLFVISPHQGHVTLGIVNGAALEDPHGLMEGTGKVHRHVKLGRVDQVWTPGLKSLLLNALERAGARIDRGD